jgi:hypothetical protein
MAPTIAGSEGASPTHSHRSTLSWLSNTNPGDNEGSNAGIHAHRFVLPQG